MNYSELPIIEPGFINEDTFNKEPGSTYANKYGEVFTVLEDGSVFPMRDDTFRKFINMFANNRIFDKSVLTGVPENNTNILLQGNEDLGDIETYSVHNISLDVDYTDIMNDNSLSIVKKRISYFTLGDDVIFKDSRLDSQGNNLPDKTLNQIINTVMISEFDLDDCFDKEKSNDSLFVNNGISVNKITLVLRKMDNPMSETDKSKFANVVLTGKAGKEIAEYFKNILVNLSRFGSVKVTNYYKNENGETVSNVYNINATSNNSVLNMIFDERNYDLYSNVTGDKISIHHRKYNKLNITSSPVEKKIRLIKTLVFNNNGHLMSAAIRDVEIDMDISRLFYTKQNMENIFFSKKAAYTLIQGALNINGKLDIPETGNIEVFGSTQIKGTYTTLSSENTSVLDPVIEIGKENQGTAPEVGIVYHTYNENKPWNDNFLKRATFYSNGVSLLEGEGSNNAMKFICNIDYEGMKSYTPDYYLNDSTLNKNFYVGDIIIELNKADVNAMMIHGARDLVNKTQNPERTMLTNYFNNYKNVVAGALMISVNLEYLPLGDVNYKHIITPYDVTPNILQNTILDLFNTSDMDIFRIRINFKIEKIVLDSIGTTKVVSFDINAFSLTPIDENSFVMKFNNIHKYSPRYYSRDLYSRSRIQLDLLFKSIPEVVLTNKSNGYFNTINMVLGNSDYSGHTLNVNGFTYNAAYITTNVGYIGFDNHLTKVKKMTIQGNIFVDYLLGTGATEKDLRKTNKIEPDINNYEVFLDVYIKYYSDSITVVGETETIVDDFGRIVDITTATEYAPFNKYDASVKKLSRIKIPIHNKESYYSLENVVDIDLSEHVHRLNVDVEYFKNKMVKDSFYIYTEVVVARKHENPLYYSYKDAVTINNFAFLFKEVDIEYRSCINDTITDPSFYTTPDDKFLNAEFNTNINSLSQGLTTRSAGIRSLNVSQDSSLKLNLSKGSGVPYSYLGGGSSAVDIDHRVFFMKTKFNKGKNNLLKLLFSFSGISNLPNNDDIRVYAMVSYNDTEKGMKYIPKYESDTLKAVDSFIPITNGAANVPLDSFFVSLDEIQLAYAFLKDNEYISTYKEEMIPNTVTRMYYDINEYPNDIDLYLTIIIDVPFPKNNSAFNDVNMSIEKLCIKLVTDEIYRETEPLEGYSKTYGILFKRETSSEYVSFVENSYDIENNVKYKDQLVNIKSSEFDGDVDTCSELANSLTFLFGKTIGELKGELFLAGTNNYKKYINLILEKATFEKEGTVGLVDEFKKVAKIEYIPKDTAYTAKSIYNIVRILDMINNPSNETITYQDENGLVPPSPSYIDKVGTTATVNALYLEVLKAIKEANSFNQALFDAAKLAAIKSVDVSCYHTDYYRQNGLASFWADEDKTLRGKVQEYEWYYYVNELFIRTSHLDNSYQHIDYASHGSYYGNEYWFKVGNDITVFSSKDYKAGYPGFIAEGATSAKIVLTFDSWQKWGRSPAWFANTESTRQKSSYGIEYILIQDGKEIPTDKGMIENLALINRAEHVVSAGFGEKIYGRKPFKIIMRRYINVRRLYNTRRTSEWVHGYIGSRTGDAAFVNCLAEWGGGRGNALPVVKSAVIHYDEYFTFPWLSPTPQEDVVDITIPGFNVYQTLQFPGLYMSSEIYEDGIKKSKILEVTTSNKNYGLCYIDDAKALMKNIPDFAIKKAVGYSTPDIDDETPDSLKVEVEYVDLSLLGYNDVLFKSYIEIPEGSEIIKLHAINDSFLNTYVSRNQLPALSVRTQISNFIPENPYTNNVDGILTARNNIVDTTGGLYVESGSPVSVNPSYSKYKFMIELKVTNINHVIQDISDNKEITYEPIKIPSIKLGASYWKKLSEEVPE